MFSEKYQDLHQKLVNVSQKLDTVDACLNVLQKEITADNVDRSKSAYECIAQVAMHVTEFDNKWNDMVLEILERSVNDITTKNHKEKSKALLRLLYKLKKIEYLIKRSCDMIEIYPDDPVAYEWICKIYIDKIDDQSFNIQVTIHSILSS